MWIKRPRGRSPPGLLAAPPSRRLEAFDIWDEPPVALDARVPALIGPVELGQLVPTLGQAHGLRRVRRHAVLVPGDVPGDRDDELAADARERNDARTRLAEALRDSPDRPAVVARVEDVSRLDHLLLAGREAPQDRLGDHRIVRRLSPRIEQRREPAPPAPALIRDRRRRRAAFFDPAVLDRDLLAERAHVDKVLAL